MGAVTVWRHSSLTMKILKLIAALLILNTSVALHAEISPEKRAEIETMLKLTGMERLADQMMMQMIQAMSANAQGVPAEFWQSFAKKVNAAELIQKIIPLYDKHYSLEDLRAVNAFYSSPAGQRMLQSMPQIMQESMQIGQAWGLEIGKQAEAELRAQMKAKAPAAAPATP